MLRLGERPSGDLFFMNVSCACTYLLHGVSSWPTGMPRPLPRLPDAEPWHSTLGTDRAVYHDDTRCPEGDSIKVEYRRWGTGGRAACEHCRAA